MQSWLPVVVTDENHPRYSQAGTTVRGQYMASTPANTNAANLREKANALAAESEAANKAAIDASVNAESLRKAATEADEAATQAEKDAETGGGGAQFEAVDVKFDVDGQVETVAVASLKSL